MPPGFAASEQGAIPHSPGVQQAVPSRFGKHSQCSQWQSRLRVHFAEHVPVANQHNHLEVWPAGRASCPQLLTPQNNWQHLVRHKGEDPGPRLQPSDGEATWDFWTSASASRQNDSTCLRPLGSSKADFGKNAKYSTLNLAQAYYCRIILQQVGYSACWSCDSQSWRIPKKSEKPRNESYICERSLSFRFLTRVHI